MPIFATESCAHQLMAHPISAIVPLRLMFATKRDGTAKERDGTKKERDDTTNSMMAS